MGEFQLIKAEGTSNKITDDPNKITDDPKQGSSMAAKALT